MASNAPIPFYEDREVALAALRSLMSEPLAEAMLQLIDALKEEDSDGSRQAAPHHHNRAPGGAGAAQGSGAAADPDTDPDAGAGAGPGLSGPIPDSITPVVGWRAWKLVPSHSSGRGPALVSLHFEEDAWRPRERKVARCIDIPLRRHAPPSCTCAPESAPAANCRCGLYSVREFRHVDKYVDGAPGLEDDEILVVGRVALWGRVMEYEDGWRAEFGYPQSFYVPRRAHAHLEAMQHLRSFDVPVLSDEDLRPLGWKRRAPRAPASSPDSNGNYPGAHRPLPDAPRLAPDIAALPAIDFYDHFVNSGMHLDTVDRIRRGAYRMNVARLGQLLALPREELARMHDVGSLTLDRFRTWRLENGYGDFPESIDWSAAVPAEEASDEDDLAAADDNTQASVDPPESAPADASDTEPDPPPIPNSCFGCKTTVMAYGHGRVLCETCRPINAQLSQLRSVRRRAEQYGGSTDLYDELMAKLEARRPRPEGGPS